MSVRWGWMIGIALWATDAPAQDLVLENDKQKVSYALGMRLAEQLLRQSVELDAGTYVQGLTDTLAGRTTLLTSAEALALVTEHQAAMKKKLADSRSEGQRRNKSEGDAFLKANATNAGVITLPSDLQYKVVREGSGATPTLADTVVAHYRGTLIDGTEVDNSYARNRPGTFAVRNVVKGWREALLLMPVGSKWQLFVPSALAYGERGAGRTIGPNATLVFGMELLSIKERDDTAVSPHGGSNQQLPVAGINVSFKLDPRLVKGSHLGERWVSPPMYAGAQDGTSFTIEAAAVGVDARGRTGMIRPTWRAADPKMVIVTPAEGNRVTITIQRTGESSLQVSADNVTRALAIKAVQRDNAMQVEIKQTP